ncbi:YslB family protein [Eupransor demetentiae]|uniref:Contains 4VR domain n=1 Tax=Eupransor demetentiae TaxID=3109584 RepID=A0ABM9N4Y5_9LACO|nr:Predicted hydrocarbon binding protein [Lactobacillaceae bacterium LMG 33000]
MNNNSYRDMLNSPEEVNSFALHLLRDQLLPNLLQQDYSNIAYWAGKELARQFPLDTIEDITLFFRTAGFGDLALSSQNKDQQTWRLRGSITRERIDQNPRADFGLETGFLAQQLESQTGAVAEGSYRIVGKHRGVVIPILTDLTQNIKQQSPSQEVAMRNTFLEDATRLTESDQLDDTDFDEEVRYERQAVPNPDRTQVEVEAATAEEVVPESTSASQTFNYDQSVTDSLLAFHFNRQSENHSES